MELSTEVISKLKKIKNKKKPVIITDVDLVVMNREASKWTKENYLTINVCMLFSLIF